MNSLQNSESATFSHSFSLHVLLSPIETNWIASISHLIKKQLWFSFCKTLSVPSPFLADLPM